MLRRRWHGIGAQRKNHGHLQSFREARCQLPFKYPTARKLRGLPLRVLVATSNNGVLLSNRLKLVIYDSACHRCLPNGLCWRKVTFWLFLSFIFIYLRTDLHSCCRTSSRLLKNTIQLTLKMSSDQVDETSVTKHSSYQNYNHQDIIVSCPRTDDHPDDDTKRPTDTPN